MERTASGCKTRWWDSIDSSGRRVDYCRPPADALNPDRVAKIPA